MLIRPMSVCYSSSTSAMQIASSLIPKPYHLRHRQRSQWHPCPLLPLVAAKRNGRPFFSGILPRSKTNSTQRRSPLIMSREGQEGAIHLIVGPMFAGKTTALLERMKAAEKEGRKIALVKSYKDKRYAVDAVVSHDGVSMPCWAVLNLADFKTKIGKEEYSKLDIIGIDEGQFFGDLYEFCKIAADHERKTIIVASLDGDFMRRTFGSTLELVPIADSIIKLTSLCELCQQPASFTLRKTIDTETEVIGGADVYMPVCRQHYISGQQAVETAKSVLEIQTDTKVKHTEMLR